MQSSECGALWAEARKSSQEKRQSNRARSTAMLRSAAVMFESRNHGAHLVVTQGADVFDFWPGTGLWSHRGSRDSDRGVHSLLKRLGVAVPA